MKELITIQNITLEIYTSSFRPTDDQTDSKRISSVKTSSVVKAKHLVNMTSPYYNNNPLMQTTQSSFTKRLDLQNTSKATLF